MFQDLKQTCFEANMQLPQLGLVIFTFGNVSVADRERGVFAIKPSGVPYATLKSEQIVVCDFEGKVVEGTFRPSSDTRTHAVLYKHWDKIGAIVHTHSTYATAFAQAQMDIPVLGTTHADHLAADVPCAPPMADDRVRGDYEYETGFQIIREFEKRGISYEEAEMILLGNHAPFVWGSNADKAVYNAGILEEIAKMAYLTCTLKPNAAPLKDTLIARHYERKHGKSAYYGQD